MEYKISGTTMQTLEISMKGGESVYSQTQQMAWMQGNVAMHTNMDGGVLQALKRTFSGSSFFVSEYNVQEGDGLVAFCPRFPGQILVRELAAGQSIICRKETFLCAEHSVTLDVFFRKQIGAGLFGGEGFILQKVTGPGKVWLDLSGEVVEKDLKAGEELRAHVGHVGVQDPSVKFDIELLKGVKNMLFGGNGLVVAKLTGPGNVVLQSMPIVNLAEEIARYIHPGGETGGAAVAGGVLGAALKVMR